MLKKLIKIRDNYKPLNAAIVFHKALDLILINQKNKIDKNLGDYLHENILTIQGIYLSIPVEILNEKKEQIISNPKNILTLQQIASEIIDITQIIMYSLEFGQHTVAYALLRMLKERVLYTFIIGEKELEFNERCEEYYDSYKQFISNYTDVDIKYEETKHYYWRQKFYPEKTTITKLMNHFEIKGYGFNSFYSHGGYGGHLDCNMSRPVTDAYAKGSSKILISETFWVIGYEIIILTMDHLYSLKNFVGANYFEETDDLLDKMSNLRLNSSKKYNKDIFKISK
ncbi:MAG: hypothetical protein WAZ12_03110 [Candidatus Absconditicoccaceae bacterium]